MIAYGPPCIEHKTQHPVTIPDEVVASYEAWKAGRISIQRITGLTVSEREILLSGTCQESWDSMFASEECDADCDGSSHPDVFCK